MYGYVEISTVNLHFKELFILKVKELNLLIIYERIMLVLIVILSLGMIAFAWSGYNNSGKLPEGLVT